MRRLLPPCDLAIAVAAGLLVACAFPDPDLPLLAWFGLAPLLVVMPRRPFMSGFVAGFAFFAVVLYWLNIVMTTYGRLPLTVSVLLYLLLVAYLALFWGTATWAACRLRQVCNYPFALTLPVFWVALELLRALLLTGFPWATLGYSQQAWLPVIQSADLFGVYGISYLLLLSNAVLAELYLGGRRQAGQRLPVPALLCLLVLLGANLGYGFWRLAAPVEEAQATARVGLVQGNIPQDLKWNPDFQQQTLQTYRRLSLQAAAAGATDLLVWPEAATPFYYQEGGAAAAAVDAVASRTGGRLLFGSPAYRQSDGRLRYLNSAFLIDAERRQLGRSDKIHLVPFGEYVPLAWLLPFVNKLVVGIGDFSPGEVNPLPLNGAQLGVLICYEVIFPELARDYVRQGSGLLVNLTNDAWFGRSSAPEQHLAMARFRAIENRVWLARAANTGISALIAPSGAIVQRSPLFVETFLVGQVGLVAAPGLYARTGDAFPLLFVLVGIVWLWQTRATSLNRKNCV
ncbi:MAG: apolipoprotein N-acyltransferase [Desulfuromonadales bacterium]|nr:apolipoprotein N-acyltransferase [Desulfuromonadales bacterium]